VVTILDLLDEYARHAAEATTQRKRDRFVGTLLTLDRFRACFEEDFPGERVRICLVVESA
jgi:hypothetical protein